MAYNEPGVRVNQNTTTDATDAVESDLSTCIVGPLYQVFDKEDASSFDSLDSTGQSFSWPSLPTGACVDLDGIRNGLIDSQRKVLATYVPTFYLVDTVTSAETTVDDSFVSSIDQDNFTITAPDDLERLSATVAIIAMNGDKFLYKPDGGLSSVKLTDVFSDSSDSFVVDSITDTKIEVADASGDYSGPSDLTEDTTTVMGGGSDQIDGVASSTAGRTVFSISGASDFSGVTVGDVVLSGKGLAGLTSLSGAVTAILDTIDGLTLSGNIDFTGYMAKVDNSTDGTTYFSKVTDFNASGAAGTHTITFADNVGTTDNDVISVTIYNSQLGYVESIAIDDLSMVVVTPQVVSETDTFIEYLTPSSAINFYPQFDLKVSYRALRRDLANEILTASSTSELEEEVGSGYSVDYRDGLGYQVTVALSNQDTLNTTITFIPVDLYPDEVAPSGLTADQDATTGYTDALEAAETVDVYNIVTLDQSSAVQSLVNSHVSTQSTSTEGNFRRGFVVVDVALGETESNTGEISPGRTIDGLASSGGNKSIKDPNVDFVTEAELSAGDRVVVTFPSEYAGTYIVNSATTDNELVLDGDDWDVTTEFDTYFDVSYDVTTSGGLHTLEPVAGSPTTPPFTHAEVGDYVELTLSAVTYRMKIVAIASNMESCTLEDEVAGDLTFSSTAASSISIIRSWGYNNAGTIVSPAVEYYVKPLSKSEQVTETIGRKPFNDRRMTCLVNQVPYIAINSVKTAFDKSTLAVAVAAKRSGNYPQQDVTNLTLGAGITEVDYGYGYFKKSLLNELAENGFTLVAQKTRSGTPYIRDMVTSKTGAGLVESEEVVVSNLDAQSKSLIATFALPPGSKLRAISNRLLGVRTAQIYAILKKWTGSEGDEPAKLVSFEIVNVSVNSTNKRQIDIEYNAVMPLAEKEIEFTINTSV